MSRPDGYQQGFVGSCTECGGQMVEHVRSSDGDRRIVQFTCQDCGADGRLEHAYEIGAIDNPDEQDGVEDVESAWVNWIDCPRCYGSGWIEDPLCDVSAAMGGRDTPCPRCHTTGSVLDDVQVGESGAV